MKRALEEHEIELQTTLLKLGWRLTPLLQLLTTNGILKMSYSKARGLVVKNLQNVPNKVLDYAKQNPQR